MHLKCGDESRIARKKIKKKTKTIPITRKIAQSRNEMKQKQWKSEKENHLS